MNYLKHAVFAATLIILLMLMACQPQQLEKGKHYAIKTATIIDALQMLDTQFEATDLVVIQLLEQLNTEDIAILSQTAMELKQLRKHIHGLVSQSGSLTQFVLNAEQIKRLYLKGGESYSRARGIIEHHWGELPLDAQVQLIQFDRQMSYLLLTMVELNTKINGSDATQAVQDIVSVSAAAVKILMMTGVL